MSKVKFELVDAFFEKDGRTCVDAEIMSAVNAMCRDMMNPLTGGCFPIHAAEVVFEDKDIHAVMVDGERKNTITIVACVSTEVHQRRYEIARNNGEIIPAPKIYKLLVSMKKAAINASIMMPKEEPDALQEVQTHPDYKNHELLVKTLDDDSLLDIMSAMRDSDEFFDYNEFNEKDEFKIEEVIERDMARQHNQSQ